MRMNLDCSQIANQYKNTVSIFTVDKNEYRFAGRKDIEIKANPEKIVIDYAGKNYVMSLVDFKISENPYVFKALSIVVFSSKNLDVQEIGSKEHLETLLQMKNLITKKRDSFNKNAQGVNVLNRLIARINALLNYLDYKKNCQMNVKFKS